MLATHLLPIVAMLVTLGQSVNHYVSLNDPYTLDGVTLPPGNWKKEAQVARVWKSPALECDITRGVNRFRNNNSGYFLFTMNEAEYTKLKGSTDWSDTGVAFYVLKEKEPNTSPLHRLTKDGVFILAKSVDEISILKGAGWKDEGAIGWVDKKDSFTDAVSLWRYNDA
jgi:hypothetical protein